MCLLKSTRFFTPQNSKIHHPERLGPLSRKKLRGGAGDPKEQRFAGCSAMNLRRGFLNKKRAQQFFSTFSSAKQKGSFWRLFYTTTVEAVSPGVLKRPPYMKQSDHLIS